MKLTGRANVVGQMVSNGSGQSQQDRVENTVAERNDHEVVVTQDAVHDPAGRVIDIHDRQETGKAVRYGLRQAGLWRNVVKERSDRRSLLFSNSKQFKV